MNDIVRPVEIMLVEDSPSDARLTLAALKMGKMVNNVTHVVDGIEALETLRTPAPGTLLPDIILLDLNLPRKSGLEVLAEIKNDSTLYRIPVIVLTTSQSEKDVVESYKLHANCYITKPFDFNQFIESIKVLENFWFAVVTLPPSSPG